MSTIRVCTELLEKWFGKDAVKHIAKVSSHYGVYFHPQYGCCKARLCSSRLGDIMSIYPEGWKTAAEYYLLTKEQ